MWSAALFCDTLLTLEPAGQSYTSLIPPLQTSPVHQQYPPQAYSPHRSPVKAGTDGSFNQLRAARRQNQQERTNHPLNEPKSFTAIPAPPPHRDSAGRGWERESGYTNSAYSHITPGADNFGEQAAGGLSGVARSVADQRARESGLEAMRNTPGYDADDMHMGTYRDSPYRQQEGPFADPYSRPGQRHDPSQSSIILLDCLTSLK